MFFSCFYFNFHNLSLDLNCVNLLFIQSYEHPPGGHKALFLLGTIHGLLISRDPFLWMSNEISLWAFYCLYHGQSQFDWCRIWYIFIKSGFFPIKFRGLRYVDCLAVRSCCIGQSWFDFLNLILFKFWFCFTSGTLLNTVV